LAVSEYIPDFILPRIVEIPCIFPVIREFILGDELAADCNHRQTVWSLIAISVTDL